ncbi:hypothetical protein BJ138DRAFT_1177840 [Hygrophoropsis aurantiaca]|uniref:Uncharacterized protein n=1 Tax=Hygrophoropsis aurantiaca TaxID=72124 RepID=A0ACB8AL63_9AGAM|nr:hypothetical protein BJ138DRAFT_1177840 [Hygrophoropsis aurantiaca]
MAEEYEVEAVTQARLKRLPRGKATWEYNVKWKGYDELSDNTWEPTSSFDEDSEHILDAFWSKINTGGRDIKDHKQFKIGEEFLVTGPPRGKKKAKPKADTSKQAESSAVNSVPSPHKSNGKDKPQASKKRRNSEVTPEEPAPKRKRTRKPSEKASSGRLSLSSKKSKATSTQATKRRRASSPGPSRISPKQSQSPLFGPDTDGEDVSDADADGDTDEVADELMTMTPERTVQSFAQETEINNDSRPEFDDLVPFCENGMTIEVEQTDNVTTMGEAGPRHPLIDSPLRTNGSIPTPKSVDSTVPSHRARAANPRIKLIDEPLLGKSMGSAILAKSRFMARNGQGSSSSIAEGNGDAGVGSTIEQSLIPRNSASSSKNKSSLLTVRKGALTSVKGKYRPNASSTAEQSVPSSTGEQDRGFTVTSWSDADADGETDTGIDIPEVTPPPAPVPSGAELLEIAGLRDDVQNLPDFEEEQMPVAPGEAHRTLVKSAEDEATAKRIELAKEQLFPTQLSSSIPNEARPSWKESTIFGAMYVGVAKTLASVVEAPNDSTTFKLMIPGSATVPVMLRDKYQEPGSKSMDATIHGTSPSRQGTFYGNRDAPAIVGALRSGGSGARIVLDTCADGAQKDVFESFLTRLDSGDVYAITITGAVVVFYSSGNLAVAERLSAPKHLIGLSKTLLVSRTHKYLTSIASPYIISDSACVTYTVQSKHLQTSDIQTYTWDNVLVHQLPCNMPPRTAQKRAAASNGEPSTSQLPSHASKKTRFVDPSEDPVNFAEQVDSALEDPLAKRKGRVKNEGYDSDSSDDGEGVVLSRRKDAEGEADEEDDMFAMGEKEEKKEEESGKKKKEEFLRLGDIEGQEFNESGSGSDSEDDEPEDEDDAKRREKAGMGYELSSFNMREEMEEGKFSADGTYVKSFDPHGVHDRWMEGLDEKEIKQARRQKRHLERIQREKMKAEERELEQSGGKGALEIQLVAMLKKGESVLEALQRIGAQAKKTAHASKKRPNGKTKDDSAEQAMVVDKQPKGLSDIDLITHLASNIMSLGDTDIYSKTYEELVRSVRSSGDVEPEWVPPSADVKYEYRWDVPEQTGEVFGPFSEDDIKAWYNASYFGQAGEKVKVRKVGGEWGGWDDIVS